MRQQGTPRERLRAEQAAVERSLREKPDEHHPDPRVAAAFADLKANDSVQGWLETQLQRYADKPELSSLEMCHRAEVETLLKRAQEERKDLEEVAARWVPSTD